MSEPEQVQRKKLYLENSVGDVIEEIFIENEVEFPVKVEKIWDTSSRLEDVKTEIFRDRVLIEGTIVSEILYIAAEDFTDANDEYYEAGEIYELSVAENFSKSVRIPGARPGMNVKTQLRIDNIQWDEAQSNNWRQDIFCELYVKVLKHVETEVVSDVKVPESLEVKKKTLTIENIVGEGSGETESVNDISFPETVGEIQNVTAKVSDLKTRIVEDKVIVEGTVKKQVFYTKHESGDPDELKTEDGFDVWIDVPGAEEGQDVDVNAEVKYIDIDLNEGGLDGGYYKGKSKSVVAVSVRVTEQLELNIVTDIEGDDVEVIKVPQEIDAIIAYKNEQVNFEKDIVFNRPVKEIVETSSDIKIDYSKTQILDGKIQVAADLYKTIYFLDLCENAVFEQKVCEKVNETIDIAGINDNMSLEIKAIVDDVSVEGLQYPDDICDSFQEGYFSPEEYPWHQLAVLQFIIKVTEPVEIESVQEVKILPAAAEAETKSLQGDEKAQTLITSTTSESHPRPPSFKFYIVQPGDTLNIIAGRFKSSVEAIRKSNPNLDSDELEPGCKLLIPGEK